MGGCGWLHLEEAEERGDERLGWASTTTCSSRLAIIPCLNLKQAHAKVPSLSMEQIILRYIRIWQLTSDSSSSLRYCYILHPLRPSSTPPIISSFCRFMHSLGIPDQAIAVPPHPPPHPDHQRAHPPLLLHPPPHLLPCLLPPLRPRRPPPLLPQSSSSGGTSVTGPCLCLPGQ